MAFKKNVWQGSKFEEKLGEEETSRRLDDGTVKGVGGQLSMKIIPIGDWDMDADAVKTVTTNVGIDKVRGCSVMIRDDGGDYWPIEYDNGTGNVGGSFRIIDNLIGLLRGAGLFFDAVTCDETNYNRGFVTIWYEG